MDQFFQRAQSWSSHKHDILGRYLTAWARKLGSRSDELAFVDLCAGAGQYGDGKPGSPLIAARVNQELGGHGKRLIVYACEDHEQTASELRELLSAEMRQVPQLASACTVPRMETLTEHSPDAPPTRQASTNRSEHSVSKTRSLGPIRVAQPPKTMVGVDQARQHCGPTHGQKYNGSDAVIEE